MNVPHEFARVDADIARAWTLPSSFYTDARVFLQEKEKLFTRDLVDALNQYGPNRPWRELVKGKSSLEIWVAQQLKRYGIRPKVIRIGEKTGRGYLKQDFPEICRRYVMKKDVSSEKEEGE